jgi:exocyst complex component 2
MASDSDVDEDELLQMALQEQAARDLSHQRPAGAGKPVVNLVRPPANSSRGGGGGGRGGGGPAKARQPSRGGGDDDDDDSEVEMLSISSGDEDGAPSSRDRGPPPPRGGGRAGARRAASRDDGDFDDDEPRSWKRVDEAEVCGGRSARSRSRPLVFRASFLGVACFDDPKILVGLAGLLRQRAE